MSALFPAIAVRGRPVGMRTRPGVIRVAAIPDIFRVNRLERVVRVAATAGIARPIPVRRVIRLVPVGSEVVAVAA